ncbi:dephospho-CoA kinase [Geovibrio thiophilus]|uniref:Dephospho-CoA kinase n=1 Tax=Geovibrio thiophilus TaxID=139438 RepID=A0A3R5YXV7_9BACT|nr:dephospho-CoA kinase [Geovibrio thiophilus]QAR32136.1 dephospho-CoA kinase [Geovibrio thiophilus]
MYLGLTGNIAGGKTTVAKMFERLGCYTVDTDILSRRVMAPGGLAYPMVVDAFGVDVVDNEGNIDRTALRKIVFNDDAARKRLEGIVHPAILKTEAKLVGEIKGKDDRAIILTQAALCVETGAYTRFDGLIVVYCEPEEQLRRLMNRDNITREEAEKIIRTQMPIDEKLKYADFVVNNSGTQEETEKDVKRVFDLIILMKQAMRQKS